jgi:ABC-type spermidine/putrescine transport system permease subunit II
MADVALARSASLRLKLSRDDLIQGGGLVIMAIFLGLVVLLPLFRMLSKSFEDADRNFVGFANYAEYFGTPSLVTSAVHTLTIGVITTVIVVVLAFIYAYALTRSRMPFKEVFRGIALIPILVPSLLPAISLVYLFGNQGMIKEVLGGHSIYGPIGIVIALAFWIFPHAVLILTTALSMADARLYEAAIALRASKLRIFWTVTLPRGCHRAQGEQAAHLLDRDPARGQVRGDERLLRRLHLLHYRLRRAQGDRRLVQRALGRHLQASRRAVELPDGGGCQRNPIVSGRANLHRGPPYSAPASGADFGTFRAARAEAQSALRRPHVGLLPGHRLHSRGHARCFGLRFVHQVLALQPELCVG